MGAIPWAPQFSNGDTGAIALMIDVDGLGHYLQSSAARSWRALAADYKRTFGVDLTISEAFRDLPTQNYFYDQMKNHGGYPAAVPGTSTHGQGLAVDVNSWVYGNSSNTDRHRWLVANAPRYGWSWELVGKPSGEPWHFNYVGGWDDWPETATPIPKRRKNMIGVLDGTTTGTGYFTNANGAIPVADPNVYNLLYRKINSDQLITPFSVSGWIGDAKEIGTWPQTFLDAEQQIVDAFLLLLARRAAQAPTVAIDEVKLAAALNEQFAKTGYNVNARLSPDDWEKMASTVAAGYSAALDRVGKAITGAAK